MSIKIITTSFITILFSLALNLSQTWAQLVSEIKFERSSQPRNNDQNIVAVSTLINEKQAAGKGIHFTVKVSNNSGKTLCIRNIADQLLISLQDERGLDISIPDLEKQSEINRANPKWKFRSTSFFVGQWYINGREEKSELKLKEFIDIPSGGTAMVNLIINQVKQVGSIKEVWDRASNRTIPLPTGHYQLKMSLSIFSKQEAKPEGFLGSFQSPMIPITYKK